MKAVRERIINLQYENTFAGDYEICTQVELDAAGVFTQFGVVPVDANRWTLLTGEEKPKPIVADSAPNVVIPSIGSVTFSYKDGQIYATFSAASKASRIEFQYIRTTDVATGNWIDMTVQQYDGIAYTGAVSEGVSYSIRYRVRYAVMTQGWSSPTTYTPATIIAPPTDLSATGAARR